VVRQKQQQWEPTGEMRIGLECSPNLIPCKKFRHANIIRFAEHMKEAKCQQCIDFAVQADKELRTTQLLPAWRKSKNNKALLQFQKEPIGLHELGNEGIYSQVLGGCSG